jgi:4'-phosphopantetheinyl transferase
MIWQTPPPNIMLDNESVHVWRIRLDCDIQRQNQLRMQLSTEEKKQADRFQFEQDRSRYQIAHGAMRMILGGYLECTPQSIEFLYSDKGKPYLPQMTNLYFNLSHSSEVALLAVTKMGEIGVDIEHHRQLDEIHQIARQCFSVQEYQQFASLQPPDNLRAFFNGWTRKEAFIKALGQGLSYPLDKFSVSLLPSELSRLLAVEGKEDEAENWTIFAILSGEVFSSAFALRQKTVMVKYWDWV